MSCTFNFKGKVALVTGSSSGIGAATAKMLAKSGAEGLVITGLVVDEGLLSTAGECRTAGTKVLEMAADLCDGAAMRALVEQTIMMFGRLDILVNCAGGVARGGVGESEFMDTFKGFVTTNLESVVYMTHLCAEHLEKTQGTIVNVSSIRSMQSGVRDSPYCVSKAGVDMFTKCMAAELGPRGIRVNCVNPGAINTNFMKALGNDPAKVAAGMARVLPVRIGGQPEHIAEAILFLASNSAAFITGSCLVADGGHMAAGLGYHYDNQKAK